MPARIILTLILLISIPAYADQEIIENVVYGHKDGMALYYDIYKPAKPNGAGIISMQSGGWFSRRGRRERLAEWFSSFTDAGYTVFAVYHGSAPRYKVPEAYADVSRAVRHIRMTAGKIGVDPNRIGVTGGSAGGHLALMVGLDSDEGNKDAPDPVMQSSNRVAVVVAYYPPVDIRPMVGKSLKRFPALDFPKDQAAGISPILFVTKDDPPTLLIHGDADKLVIPLNSTAMHKALKDSGVTTELLIVKGGGHGFRDPQNRAKAGKARLDWFDSYLKK
ncbi:MAG: alpha/beta hydrolase [Desulfobacterales bacterium]